MHVLPPRMDDVLPASAPLRHNEYVAAVTKIRRHYARGKSKSRVVMGDAAAEYMVSRGLAATIADAEALGRRMAHDRIWVHVSGRVEFLAAHRLYRFEQATVAETRLAIEAARVAAAAAAAALDNDDDCDSDQDGSVVYRDCSSASGEEGEAPRSSSVRASKRRPSSCGVRSSGGGALITASASCYSVRGDGRRGSMGSDRSRPSLQFDMGAPGVGGGLLVDDGWNSPPCRLPASTTRHSVAAVARRCSSLHSDHTEGVDPLGARRATVAVAPARSGSAGPVDALLANGEGVVKEGGAATGGSRHGDGGLSSGRTSGDRHWDRELLLHHSSSINSSGTPSRHVSVDSAHGGEDGGPAAAGRPLFVRTPFGSADPSRRTSIRGSARWSLTAFGTALTRTVSRSGEHRRASTASRPSAASPPRAPVRPTSLGRAASGVVFKNHLRDSLSDPHTDDATVGVGRLQGVASAPVVGPSDLWPPLPAVGGGDAAGLDAADAELAAFAAQQCHRGRRRSLVRPLRRRSVAGVARGTVPSQEPSGGAGWAAGDRSGAAASAAAAAAAVAAATAAAAAAHPPSPTAAAARRRRFSSVAPGAADAPGADAGGARAALARASRRWLRRLRPKAEGAAAVDGRADASWPLQWEARSSRR